MINIPDYFINQCVITFGSANQLDILQEECAELIKAISKYKRNLSNGEDSSISKANIIEELTHVAMSSEIVTRILSITPDDIQKEVDKKAQKCNIRTEIKP